MKILELNILEFGGLCDRHITLADGLNLLEGENEAGKSTVWLFIKFMLYGMPRKGHEDRERSVSWRTHRAVGSMRVRHEGEEYRIERSFTESGRTGNDKLTIYRHTTGEIVFAGKEAGEVFLGVPREVFESTCGIGQKKVGDLGGKKGADAIQNLLSSADESTDISHIKEKLERIRVQYRHKNGKGGQLYDLSGEINEAKKRWDRAQETEKNLTLLEEKMNRNQKQMAQSESKLTAVSERLTQLGILEVLRRFEHLRAMEERQAVLDGQIESLRRREQKTARSISEADAADLRSLAEHLRAAKTRQDAQEEQSKALDARRTYEEADAELGERVEANGGAASILAKMKKKSRAAGACFGTGAAIVALGGVGFLLTPIVTVAGAALGILLLVLGIVAQKGRKKIAAEFGQRPERLAEVLECASAALLAKKAEERERTELAAAKAALEAHVLEMTERLRTALERTLPPDEVTPTVAAAEREIDRISAFLREYGELHTARSALVQSIENERRGLAQYDEVALREQLTIDLAELQSLDPVRLETERKFLKTQLGALENSFRSSQIELISARANAEDPIVLADRWQTLSDAYARAEEYCNALELAIEAIAGASDAMSGNITPALGRRAGEMMAYISGGRYETLSAGADYTPSLLDESRMTVTADALSAGTSDAAYLSLRIALMMELFDGELPPLMLDDALCQIDDKRITRTLTLLAKLGEEELQTLLFTCHTREARICEELSLPYRKNSL